MAYSLWCDIQFKAKWIKFVKNANFGLRLHILWNPGYQWQGHLHRPLQWTYCHPHGHWGWWGYPKEQGTTSGDQIEIGTSLVDWELFKSVFKSFKIAIDIQPNKVVHQLLGCLDSDLLKLLYRENNKPEGLNEENLLRLIKCIAVKSQNVWCLREKLHQMTQDMGELVSSFTARLQGQARLCEYTMACRAARCTQPNDFMDTIIMGELVRGLADHKIKELVLSKVTQVEDLAALVKLVEAKEYGKCSSHESGDINPIDKSDKKPQCGNCGTSHPKSREWKEKCPALKKTAINVERAATSKKCANPRT